MKYLKHYVWCFVYQFKYYYWNDLICISKFKHFCGDCNSERGNFRNVVFRPRKTVSLNLDGSPGNWMIFFLFHPIHEERENPHQRKMCYIWIFRQHWVFLKIQCTRCLFKLDLRSQWFVFPFFKEMVRVN